jgi:hypothetical protein
MRILRYTDGWTRRHFLEQTAKGIAAAGVLAPLWDVIERTGSCEAAYPPELLSIEAYTKGKLKAGQELNADNVDLVKDLLCPITYHDIKHEGRVADLVPTENDIYHLNPKPFIDATAGNRGKYKFGPDGNVWTVDGKPWQGGSPFPEPKNALEVRIGAALSWGKWDCNTLNVQERDYDIDGVQNYAYQFHWAEWQTVGRLVLDPKPYQPGRENLLRYNSIIYTAPEDQRGTAFLQIWSYDQRKFPEFYGYTPMLKRVRTFPTDQRFEPLLAGENFYITYLWNTGDPILTWGNFKLVSKGPMLYGILEKAYQRPNWGFDLCGGKTGKKFLRLQLQLVPEMLVIQEEPVGYPRAPIGKKHIFVDARTQHAYCTVSYDRAGKLWYQYELGNAYYDKSDNGKDWPDKAPEKFWAWSYVLGRDIQNGTSMHFENRPVQAGWRTSINDPATFDDFCTMDAIRRLGR